MVYVWFVVRAHAEMYSTTVDYSRFSFLYAREKNKLNDSATGVTGSVPL